MKKTSESTENPRPVRPLDKAVEESIVKRLDKEAKEDSPAPGMAVQDRQETHVKLSSTEEYAKVACALSSMKLKKKLSKFKG